MIPQFGTYSSSSLPTGDDYWTRLANSQSGFLPAQGLGSTISSGMSAPIFQSQPTFDAVPTGVSASDLLSNGGFAPKLDAAVTGIPQSGLFNSVSNNPQLFLLFMQSLQERKFDVNDKHGYKDYSAKKGELLKECAEESIQRRGSTVGKCAKGVRLAIEDALGESLNGADAHLWGDKLAKRKDFKEVEVSGNALKKLPAGAIVVWGKTDASPSGHISISDGNGNELSDHKATQLTNLRGDKKCRVFIPV